MSTFLTNVGYALSTILTSIGCAMLFSKINDIYTQPQPSTDDKQSILNEAIFLIAYALIFFSQQNKPIMILSLAIAAGSLAVTFTSIASILKRTQKRNSIFSQGFLTLALTFLVGCTALFVLAACVYVTQTHPIGI